MNLKSLNEAVLTSSAALVSATVLRLVDELHVELESMKLELLTKVSSISKAQTDVQSVRKMFQVQYMYNMNFGLQVSRAAEALRRVCDSSYSGMGAGVGPEGRRGVRLERRCLQLDMVHFERVALAIRALERSLRAPDWDAKLVRPVEPAQPASARNHQLRNENAANGGQQQVSQHALFAIALSADTHQVLLADGDGMQLRQLQMPNDWASIDPLVPTRQKLVL